MSQIIVSLQLHGCRRGRKHPGLTEGRVPTASTPCTRMHRRLIPGPDLPFRNVHGKVKSGGEHRAVARPNPDIYWPQPCSDQQFKSHPRARYWKTKVIVVPETKPQKKLAHAIIVVQPRIRSKY